jgi:hypothetical protein
VSRGFARKQGTFLEADSFQEGVGIENPSFWWLAEVYHRPGILVIKTGRSK